MDFQKEIPKFRKKIADLERRVRSQQSSERQYHGKTMVLISKNNVVPTEGYATVTNVLSDHTAIQFAVPSREWNELEKSEEWTDFSSSSGENSRSILLAEAPNC